VFSGLLALTELGFEVEKYYASEIDHEAMCVAEVRHPTLLKHVGDVQEITDKMVTGTVPRFA